MKKIFTIALLFAVGFAHSQELTWSPEFIQETSNGITITVNAIYGNQGLLNYTPTTDVYIHMGAITNLSTDAADWKYVRTVWATTYPWENAKYIGNNQWQFTIDTTGGLRAFYGMTDTAEHIQKIAILFRNGNGDDAQRNGDGSDMYIPVYGSGQYARIDVPLEQPEYDPIPIPINAAIGTVVPIVARASLSSSSSDSLHIYFNGSLLSTTNGTNAAKDSTSATVTAYGTQTIIAKASNGSLTNSDTVNFYIAPSNIFAPLPAGVTDGLNYYTSPDSMTLVLYAPHKSHIVVVGDFNNWIATPSYQMYETPDSLRYWITLKGLTSQVQYAYQYVIDDTLQLADYNAQLVLDKSVDPQISAATYPNLKAYPTQASGNLASVLETGQTPYNWQVPNFVRPNKANLMIYELLMRDFTAAENWQTVEDTLTYLKRLGINAIEVMPFCNFEGYSSWGYNPNFYFAPDKVYGTPTALKQFVDACHAQGIAVIMDLTMDDVYGSSPLASMYWNSATNTPAANNPWLNVLYTHPYLDGNQFNHDAPATRALRSRIYAYWINNYHLDGFRFDLAGGYTQTNTCDDVNFTCTNSNAVTEWNYYDQDRVNALDSVTAEMAAVSPTAYTIFEIFVSTSEEANYVNKGDLVWSVGDQNGPITQATMGYPTSSGDFSNLLWSNTSGWTLPGVVGYYESHDETVGGDERVQFKNENFGNSSNSSYNVLTDTAIGLARDGAAAAFWALMPGPKMMWMFEELGYDFSPDACSTGALTCGNTDPKPLPWGAPLNLNYNKNANRVALFNVYSKLLKLRNIPNYIGEFTNNTASNVNHNFSSYIKWMSVYSDSIQIMVLANFDVNTQTGTVSFPSTGTWYNYLTGKDTTITSTSLSNVTLTAGQYGVYVNIIKAIQLPVTWLGFTAQAAANSTALLNWSTTNEVNNSYFEVERSTDGINFTAIGDVNAATGNNAVNKYQFLDEHPANGVNYYMLKQVDKDGAFTYSSIATITINSTEGLWKVYPNPASSGNTALYLQAAFSNFDMSLTDVSGKVLYHYSAGSVSAGSNISIPVTGLAHGVYLLKITTDQASSTEKIVVN
jgi:1,4-alpha-glucan branching enzyme